jgi:purine-binding chemotaxis protein CheW
MAESSAVAHREAQAQRFLLFRLEKDVYALPADMISEVIRTPASARVPQAPAALLGIANLRGIVVPLVSLRALMGGTGTEEVTPLAIVLAGAVPVAVAVDGVETLVTVDAGDVTAAEKPDAKDSAFLGAFPAGSGVAKIVNIHDLLNSAFAQRAQAQNHAREAARMRVQTRENVGKAHNSDFEMLVTFEIAGQEYALCLEDVREIVTAPENLTAVAQSDNLVLGMMVLREELVPVLSMRGLLGFGAWTANDDRQKVVIARVSGTTVGLMTDRAKSILAAHR